MITFKNKPDILTDPISVNHFYKEYKRGEISFNSPFQRGYVWSGIKASSYIHSVLCGIAKSQSPFIMNKRNGIKYIDDGQQRGLSLIRYIDGKFSIVGDKDDLMLEVDGELYDLRGKKFKHLPERLQETILDFSISVCCMLNATLEVEALYFSRVNSGQSMTNVDLSRSRNLKMESIVNMRSHPLFDAIFKKEKSRKNYPEDEILVKSYIALFEDIPNYSSSHFSDVMENLDIEEYKTKIFETYDLVLEAYKSLLVYDEKRNALPMILKKTHFFAYLPYVSSFETGDELAKWMLKFYSNLTEEYKTISRESTTRLSNAIKRQEIVEKSIMEFLQ